MKLLFRSGAVSRTSITGDSPALLHLFGGLGQESQYGVANSAAARREQNRQALLDFVGAVQILPLTDSVSETYGQLRVTLKKQPIGPNDTWIAAHALAMQLPLVTNNTREFSRVTDLVIDTWMAQD